MGVVEAQLQGPLGQKLSGHSKGKSKKTKALRGWGTGGRGKRQVEDPLPGAGFSHPCSDSSDSKGGGIRPSSPSTECEVTNEMEETGTAGGMTWLASHCPLLGRVIPSTADVFKSPARAA